MELTVWSFVFGRLQYIEAYCDQPIVTPMSVRVSVCHSSGLIVQKLSNEQK